MLSRCGVFSFKMLSTFRRTTHMVLCMLVLQDCQSSLNITSDSDELPSAATSVSEQYARGKNRSLITDPSAPSFTSGPLNLSTIPSSAVASQIQQTASRANSHTPASMAPSDITIQPTEMYRQSAFRAFATSSGEQVVFKQVGNQWEAEVSSEVYKSQRTLPVVSAVPIVSFLSWLQEQDVRTSKSRIHILNASYPHHNCCVYLGKMGLLGGVPASEKKQTKWVIGPSIILDSNSTRTEIYNIPPGYCYKDYRVKQGLEPIIQRASCTIYYVEAQSPEEISKLAEFTNGGELEAKLAADFVNVVTLGKLEGNTPHSVSKTHQDIQAPGCMYAALVVHGDIKTNRPFREENQIRLELEVEVEEVDTKPPYIASLSALSSPDVGQVIDSAAFSGHEFAMQSGGSVSRSNYSDHPSVIVTSPYVDYAQADSRAPASPFPLGTEGSPMSVNSYHSPVILSSLSLEEKEVDISSSSIQTLLIECMQQSPTMA